MSVEENFPGEEPAVGRERLRAVLQSFLDGFPDLKFVIEDQVGEGNKVVTRWSAKGRIWVSSGASRPRLMGSRRRDARSISTPPTVT
jgi:hypothetical protein